MINRAERLFFFLVVWLTMFSFQSGWGQNFYAPPLKKDFFHLIPPGTKIQEITHNPDYIAGIDLAFGMIFAPALRANEYDRYPQRITINNQPSAIFCKIEWEMEKATRIPFRFRLGSLADCNAMEGKH